MESITDNMQKYENYREQMSRLNKAMKAEFYLEAIFIEYAIMEDRLESAVRHSGRFSLKEHDSLKRKCDLVKKLIEEKKGIARKYFTIELIDGILMWKDSRNQLIHALMKQSLHTEDLQTIALDGQSLLKTLSSKVSSYNKAIDRKNAEKAQIQGQTFG